MILGIGTDIVHISRVEKVLSRFGERFAQRLLSPAEQAEFERRDRCAAYLAKRFAAKEAAAKALGVGIGERAQWVEIEIVNDNAGAPRLNFHGLACEYAREKGVVQAHVSLSDERDLAQALVILES